MKKNNNKILTIALVICVVVAGGYIQLTNAFSGDSSVVIENVENLTIGGQSEEVGMLGGISNLGSLTLDDNLVVGGTSTFTGAMTSAGALDVSRLTQGGGVYASSTTVATGVLTEAQLISYSQLDYTPGDLAVTLTLPATSTMVSMIPNAGDTMIFKVRNLDAVAATSTTIAAGTGIDLVENENGDVVIEGGNEAYLRFTREADTDVTVSVDEYIVAD